MQYRDDGDMIQTERGGRNKDQQVAMNTKEKDDNYVQTESNKGTKQQKRDIHTNCGGILKRIDEIENMKIEVRGNERYEPGHRGVLR